MKSINKIRVRGFHLDMFSHVNNARYLEFLEEGRWVYTYDNEVDLNNLAAMGLIFNVVNININYKRGAVLNDLLRVETVLHSVGNKSAVIKQEIYREGDEELIVDAMVTFVFIDTKLGKTVPIDDSFKELWPDLNNFR